MSVQVLLSTHNGAKYLKPLLDSLLAQDYPTEILVRDDGSFDDTVAVLREYASEHKNVKIITGENIGFVNSFFKLLEISSAEADYIALCDQDDVWQNDKISRSLELSSRYPPETAVLYCSRLTVTDENLNVLKHTDIPRKDLSFRNALVECPEGLGCTILLSKAARRLLSEFPRQAYSHDWWIYLVLSGFGTIIYDEEPRILYRQHASNAFGVSLNVVDAWRARISRFIKVGKTRPVTNQAEEFMRIYGASLSEEKKKVLERFLEKNRLWPRLRYALSCDLYRQSTFDHFVLRVLIALNRL